MESRLPGRSTHQVHGAEGAEGRRGARHVTDLFTNAVLTCPAGNPSSMMSPAGATSLEDQQYMEKLKQLSKYIEPLRRMINKIDKNEGGSVDGTSGN